MPTFGLSRAEPRSPGNLRPADSSCLALQALLARGRLIASGRPAEIRDHPKVQEVYLGTGKTFERQDT